MTTIILKQINRIKFIAGYFPMALTLVACGGAETMSDGNLSANAGGNLTVDERSIVSLEGDVQNSSGGAISYQWQQTSGTRVQIEAPDAATMTFLAPNVEHDEALSFRFTATDASGVSYVDEVSVNVTNTGDIVVLTDLEVSEVHTVTSDGFSVDADAILANRNPGDIIISSPSSAFPSGALVKLMEKNQQGSVVTFVTEPAALNDVAQDGGLTLSHEVMAVDYAQMQASATPEGMSIYLKNNNLAYSKLGALPAEKNTAADTMLQKFSLQNESVEWDPAIFQGCDEPSEMQVAPEIVVVLEDVGLYQHVNDPSDLTFDTGVLNLADDENYERVISVEGCFAMNININFDIDFNWLGDDHYMFSVEPEQYGELQVTSNLLDAGLNMDMELQRWILPSLHMNIGVIPVWITPEISLNWGIDARAGATVYTGLSEYAAFEVGLEYIDGALEPITQYDFDLDIQPPRVAAFAETQTYIGPSVALKIYDVVGPTAELQVYADAFVQPEAPWWGVTVGARANAAMKVEIFNQTIADLSFSIPSIFEVEIETWLAEGAALQTPVNLEAISREDFVELVWEEVAGATEYTIYYSVDDALGLLSQHVDSNTSSAIIEGLENATEFYFAVVASDGVNFSDFSDIISAITSVTDGQQ